MRIERGEVVDLQPKDRVSLHFLAEEFSANRDPYPVKYFDRMLRIAAILERCRAVFGRTLKITSGWRSPSANEAAKGAARSQHCHGRAVDFRDWRGDNAVTGRIYKFLEENLDELGIGGLGWYPVPPPPDTPLKGPDGKPEPRTYARIHIDIRPRRIGQAVARWTH